MNFLSTKRLLTAREQELVALRKSHKALVTRIKTERTKLDALKDGIKTTVSAMTGLVESKVMELHQANLLLRKALEQCMVSKLFNISERGGFEGLLESLEAEAEMIFGNADFGTDEGGGATGLSPEELENLMREMAEKMHERGGFKGRFEEFRVEISPEQQQDAKEIFKRLAVAFHPDKASRDERLEEKYHAIMQSVNEAFQRGDVAALLELERELLQRSDILAGAEAPLADLVEQELARVKREIELYKDQLKRYAKERKEIEKTPEGAALKEHKRAEKAGANPRKELEDDMNLQIAQAQKTTEMMNAALSGAIPKRKLIQYMDEAYGSKNSIDDLQDIGDMVASMMNSSMMNSSGSPFGNSSFRGSPFDEPIFGGKQKQGRGGARGARSPSQDELAELEQLLEMLHKLDDYPASRRKQAIPKKKIAKKNTSKKRR
jgi:hypothetical protein